MNKPIFLIITTIYNARMTISSTLDSLLSQECNNVIHYIYDDGSKINCDDIIQKYIKKVNQSVNPYRIIYEKGDINLGVDKAHEHVFKKAFKEFECDYFTWLDSGDYYGCNVIKNVTNTVIKNSFLEWIHNDYYEYYDDGTIAKKPISAKYKTRYLKRQLQLPNFMFGYNFHYGNFFIKKESYIKMNNDCFYFPNSMHYDDQIILMFSLANKKYKYLRDTKSYIYIIENHAGGVKPINDSNKNEYEFLFNLKFFEKQKTFIESLFNMKTNGMILAELTKEKVHEKKYKKAFFEFKRFFKEYNVPKKYHPHYWKYVSKYIIYFSITRLCRK